MKTVWESGGIAPCILDGGKLSASRSGSFTPVTSRYKTGWVQQPKGRVNFK